MHYFEELGRLKEKYADNTSPSGAVLRLYKDLGGRFVTIRSDSHEKHHLGAYIEDTNLTLKALGYEQYCTFERMQPIFHELKNDKRRAKCPLAFWLFFVRHPRFVWWKGRKAVGCSGCV